MKEKKTHIIEKSAQAVLLLTALSVVVLIYPNDSFAFESAKFAIREICGHMEGNLGGLLMATAAVGAIVAAAFGNFKATYSMIIVGIGAFTISAMLSLYFPDAAKECMKGNGDAGQMPRDRLDAPEGFPTEMPARQYNADIAIAVASGKNVDFSKAAAGANKESEQKQEPEEFDEAMAELADSF